MKRDHRWNEVRGMLSGKTVVLLGGGTSIRGLDFNKLKRYNVIALNHSIEYYPAAQMLIFADKIFLHKTEFDLSNYKGLIFCSDKCRMSKPIDKMYADYKKNLYVYEDIRDEPLINPKMGLYHPTSTGIQALNLAIQMKAKKIYLLGYDYYKDNGDMHYYPDRDHHRKYTQERMGMKVKKFKYFDKWSSRVINLNLKSMIEEFPKQDWRDVI